MSKELITGVVVAVVGGIFVIIAAFIQKPTDNGAAQQTADAANTRVAIVEQTQSAIAAAPPTLTPIPSLTPPPLIPSACVPNGVITTFQDNFDGSVLSNSWQVWSTRPPVGNGILAFESGSSGEPGIYRSGINENEGFLAAFQYKGSNLLFNLQTGTWRTDSFRQISLSKVAGDAWNVYYTYGDREQIQWDMVEINPDDWHCLLMRVGTEGKFYVQVWKRDTPNSYLLNTVVIPNGNFAGYTWDALFNPYSGTLYLDTYEELRFPENFEMPDRPPQQ